MVLSVPIKGRRIYLRMLTEEDATDRYARWLNDPEVHRFLDTKKATIAELQEYIANKNENPNALLCGIFLNSGEYIGTIKLEPVDSPNGESAIAVMVGEKRYWGGGYGSEAMRLLIGYAVDTLGISAVYLGVSSENRKAVLAYEMLGFRLVPDLAVVMRSQRLFQLIEPRHQGEIVMVLTVG